MDSLLGADVIAIGYSKNEAGEILLAGDSQLVASVEKYFEINLIDEINFFSPSGKAGELFEIPVLHEGTDIDRLYLVGIGDGTLPSQRAAGAALGRKVRGKALNLISLLPSKKAEVKAHAISIVLGAYTWNLKTSTPAEIPTFSIAPHVDLAGRRGGASGTQPEAVSDGNTFR